jgi:hypothetical protein
MDFIQIDTWMQQGVIGLLIVLAGMIKIPKLELNIWSLIGRTIGRSVNKEMMDQFNDVQKEIKGVKDEVDKLKRDEELERMRQARQCILRFNDEILFNKRHSKEHFDEILNDIDVYEEYCAAHEDYENNKAVLAISTIREVYKECLRDHDFLTYEKKVG